MSIHRLVCGIEAWGRQVEVGLHDGVRHAVRRIFNTMRRLLVVIGNVAKRAQQGECQLSGEVGDLNPLARTQILHVSGIRVVQDSDPFGGRALVDQERSYSPAVAMLAAPARP
jgi:hypothetical protein